MIGLISVCCFAIWSGSLLIAIQFTEGMGDALFMVFRLIAWIFVPLDIICGLLGLLEPNRKRTGAMIGFAMNCSAMIFMTLTRLYN
jgi:hypothetical protein